MSLTRLHFDTDVLIGTTIKQKTRVIVNLVYLGENKYHVKATNALTKRKICNREIDYPALKGNGRKSYAKLRDLALNVIEDRPLDYYRKAN